ncbi:MAG: molecular chaperone DnaK [Desulfococcus sp.]|nr:MAG: molecular chaperone DnaK [Desulfococcus sp.]
MNSSDHRYIVGIDLGTTNSAVSFAPLPAEGDPPPEIRLFPVPQLTGPGEFADRPVLPSFLYIPGEYDIEAGALEHPWPRRDPWFVGVFARDHGAGVPARLISSAKSWLCHEKTDRRARILPWGGSREIQRLSPVEATAAYLDHIRNAWNRRRPKEEECWLEHQLITITVPASFDEVARDLTLEAAQLAGLQDVTLLEEPLAAFYHWLHFHEADWADHVTPGELILVCDMGGGTTDFTLITLREADGGPVFERIAVGDHLILGGDNIDLALARIVEGTLAGGKTSATLNADRWKSLCQQCRQAKERILNGEADEFHVALMGKGRHLIGGSLTGTITATDVHTTVTDGFFPLLDREAPRLTSLRKGITEFGLPYESEAAVTRHMGWFLDRHAGDAARFTDHASARPDLILFNGGSLKSSVIRNRVREAAARWFDGGQKEAPLPRELINPDPDLAVALGAAYYGLVKIGCGVRVGSGSSRSYYLGVTSSSGEDHSPGIGPGGDLPLPEMAVCLVERGLEEGRTVRLEDRRFTVLTNRPVRFSLYRSSFRSGDRSGDLIDVDDSLTAMPPLNTMIRFGKKGARSRIPVSVEAHFTEMGTLALWCVSDVTDHRWRLQFQLRNSSAEVNIGEQNILDESRVADITARIHDAFSVDMSSAGGRMDRLSRDLARDIEMPRSEWPLGLIRRMTDTLIPLAEARLRHHRNEVRWLNLTGFCLRPGFGDGFDADRIRRIWKLYKTGPVFTSHAQNRSEWWVLWRRIAGGLKPGQQRQFIQDLSPVMISGKKGKQRFQERLEIWMAVANMERLITRDKRKWGEQLLSEIKPKTVQPQHFWCLGRIGAREPLYGPVDRVLRPEEIHSWLRYLMETPWKDTIPVCAALASLARKTGDMTRDLNDPWTGRVRLWLENNGGTEEQDRMVSSPVPLEKMDETAIFGESLPAGLVLRE